MKMHSPKDVRVVRHTPSCLRHGAIVPGTYNSKYDSFYCEICNRWLERQCKCGGDDCERFPGRPDKPINNEANNKPLHRDANYRCDSCGKVMAYNFRVCDKCATEPRR